MNRYIRKSLEPGEEIVFNGRLHWSYVFGYMFWSVVLLLVAMASAVYGLVRDDVGVYFLCAAAALVVVAIVVWVVGIVVRTRTEFVVTRTRFIQKNGIFNIHMMEIPLFKVETVNFHQSLFQRMIGTGGIELVGSGGTPHFIECVESPMDVRRAIVSTINQSNCSAAEPGERPSAASAAKAGQIKAILTEEEEGD